MDYAQAPLTLDRVLQDVDGTYRNWFEEKDLVGMLVRPDFVVYGGGRNEADLQGLLESLRGQLTRPPTSVDGGSGQSGQSR